MPCPTRHKCPEESGYLFPSAHVLVFPSNYDHTSTTSSYGQLRACGVTRWSPIMAWSLVGFHLVLTRQRQQLIPIGGIYASTLTFTKEDSSAGISFYFCRVFYFLFYSRSNGPFSSSSFFLFLFFFFFRDFSTALQQVKGKRQKAKSERYKVCARPRRARWGPAEGPDPDISVTLASEDPWESWAPMFWLAWL